MCNHCSIETELVKEIDLLTAWVLKEDIWDQMTNRLSNLLLKGVDESQKGAINEVITRIAHGEGDLTYGELDKLLKILEEKLGADLGVKLKQPVESYHLEAYKQVHVEMGIDFAFNKTTERVLNWLNGDVTYWIGNHYGTQLNEKIREGGAKILTEGLSREDAGFALKKFLGEEFKKSADYWEGLSNHIITRAREFGRIDGYEAAGITKARIVAIIDHRTSAICRELNGKVIPVGHLKERREKILKAKTPEAAKKISGWLNDEDVENYVKGKTMEELLGSNKTKVIGSPPYHWKCRTVLVGEG